jgi:hypothetical protein
MTEDPKTGASPDSPAPGGESRTQRPRRFDKGLLLGLGLGALAETAIVVVAVVVVMLVWGNPLDGSSSFYPSGKVETVPLTGPWLNMTDAQHGTVAGWSYGGMGSGDGMPGDAVATFDLSTATEQNGAAAVVSVTMFVTAQTQLLMGGEPWTAEDSSERSAVEQVFGSLDSPSDAGYGYLDMRKLSITFRVDGGRLFAESIDASKTQEDPPFLGMGAF